LKNCLSYPGCVRGVGIPGENGAGGEQGDDYEAEQDACPPGYFPGGAERALKQADGRMKSGDENDGLGAPMVQAAQQPAIGNDVLDGGNGGDCALRGGMIIRKQQQSGDGFEGEQDHEGTTEGVENRAMVGHGNVV